jgi:ABC-2 type transport system permease protein
VNAGRTRPVPKYVALFLRAAQRELGFRGELLVGLLGQVCWAAATYLLWRSAYAETIEVGGMRWAELRAYIVTTFALNAVLFTGGAEGQIFAAVRSGQIAVDLTQPISLVGRQLCLDLGATLVRGSAGVAVLTFGLATGLVPVPSIDRLAWFAVSLVLAFGVRFFLSYLLGLLTFWTLNYNGLIWARTALANLLAGTVIPIGMLPAWVAPIARYAPFQAVIFTPTTLLLGQAHAPAERLAVQAAWVVALGVLSMALWSSGARKLVTHGG